LGDKGQLGRITHLQADNIRDSFYQQNLALRQLAHGADDFRMAGMTDEQDFTSAFMLDFGFPMHFGDKRTGGVNRKEISLASDFGDRFGHAVGRENHRSICIGDFIQIFDKDCALPFQIIDNVSIVDDFMPDIDWSTMKFQRLLDGINRANDTCAKSAGGA
jgi:hypothetical protein